MSDLNPVERNQTLTNLAEQAIEAEGAKGSNAASDILIMVGLLLSATFTIIYMVIALGGAMLAIGWGDIVSYGMGFLLGIAAIMPGEGAIWIWKTKLQTDTKINNSQIATAWIAGLLAAVSASISTVSFFAYLLQGLMPGWYNGETASGVNIINIAASWAVFGISVFVYYGLSSQTKTNKGRAQALNLIDNSINSVIKGVAFGIQEDVESIIEDMRRQGKFASSALKLIERHMGEDFEAPANDNMPPPAVARQHLPESETSQPEARPTNDSPFRLQHAEPEREPRPGNQNARSSNDSDFPLR